MRNRIHQLLGERVATGSAIRSEAQGENVVIYVYDVIDGYFGAGAKALAEELKNAAGAPVTLRINSPGGDAFEGRAMASLIRSYTGETRAIVDGLAASAASTIALSAKQMDMATGSFFMIHRASTLSWGNAADLEQTAKLLAKIDAELAAEYARYANVKPAEAEAWMDAETWFTADEAVSTGFAKSVLSDAAGFKPVNLAAFAKPPQALADHIANLGKQDAGPSEAEVRSALERRLKLFDFPA